MNDTQIIYWLQQHNIRAFKILCHDHAEDMTILAYTILADSKRASEIVNEILLRLWSEDGFRKATTPLHKFLYREVRKECERLTWNMQTLE
jgi:DNA-directed RNA polymerase specialized sigma24 family protein